MNKLITFLPKKLLKNYVIKHFLDFDFEDFLLLYEKIDIPLYLFENNNILNSNEDVLFKMLDKSEYAFRYFNIIALTEKNINKIVNSDIFITDKDIEKFPQLLTNLKIVKKVIERYKDIIKKIPENLITNELVEILKKSYYVLTEEELLSHRLFIEDEVLVKKSLKKYPNLIMKIKEPSENLIKYAIYNGFEPNKEYFYDYPYFKQSKNLLLKAFENDPSIIVFFNDELLNSNNVQSACNRNYIASEKDLLENSNLCKIGSIMEKAIRNNPMLIKYIKYPCYIDYLIVQEALAKYKITKEDLLKNPDIAKNHYIMNCLPEYKLYDTHLLEDEKIKILSDYLLHHKNLSIDHIPFLDYRFGGQTDIEKLNLLKEILYIEMDEKDLEYQKDSSQTLDKLIDGVVNIKYIMNKFSFKYPDVVSLNDEVISILSEVVKINNFELLSQLVNNIYEFVGYSIDKKIIEDEINKYYKVYKEYGISGFYKNDNGDIKVNITSNFYNNILNQHRNHFMSEEKLKIEREILPKLRLTEKKEETILNGRKIEKIKRKIISKEFGELGITESNFNELSNSVKEQIMSNKDIKKYGVVITDFQFKLLNKEFKQSGTLNFDIVKRILPNVSDSDVIKFVVNKYEQIKFKLVKQITLNDDEKYISNSTKLSLKGINPTNFVVGDKMRYYKNLSNLLLSLDNEKLNVILENKGLLNEVSFLLPFVDLISELDINTFIKIITDYDRISEKINNANNDTIENSKDLIITKIDDIINLANAYSSLDDISLFALGRNVVSMVNEIKGEKYLGFYLKMLQRQFGSIPPITTEIGERRFESGLYSDVERLLIGKIPNKDSCIDLFNSAGYGTFEEVLLKNSGDVILVRDSHNKLMNRILLFRRGNIVQMVTASGSGISLDMYKQLADMIINQAIATNDNIDYVFVNTHSSFEKSNDYDKIEDVRFITKFAHADFGQDAYLVSSKNMIKGIKEKEISLNFEEEPKGIYPKLRKKILYEPTEIDISRIRALNIIMETDEYEKENKSRNFEPFYMNDYSKVVCGEDWYVAIKKDGTVEEVILPIKDSRIVNEIETVKEYIGLNLKTL